MNVIKNLIKVAIADMRRRRWDFFRLALILSLGFSALYTTLSLKSQLIAKLEEQAKYLLTSDLAISVRRSISEQELNSFQKTVEKYPHQISQEITLLTVAGSKDLKHKFLPTAINVKWVDENYPFYSRSKFTSGRSTFDAWKTLHLEDSVFLNKDQAERLDLKINDEIQIFGKYFKIADLIDDDATTGSRFFSLFPIVFASLKNVPNKDIFGIQTSFFETRHVKWGKELTINEQQNIKIELEKQLTDPALRVSLPKDSSEQNQRLWDTISDFLGILTLCSLILSILGLFTLMRYQWSHEEGMHQKFHLLGLTNVERFIIKFLQTNLLALISVILCLLTSYPMTKGLSQYLPTEMQANMEFFHLSSFATLAFSLWFVLNVVSCYFFFLNPIRYSSEVNLKKNLGAKTWKVLTYSILGLVFAMGVGRFLTRSWLISIVVILGLLILYFLLVSIINFILKISKPYFNLPRKIKASPNWQIILRLIFRSWQKNLSLYSMTVSCLGVVYFLLTLLMALQVSMKTQLSFTSEKPDLFLFDVQPEDTESLSQSLAQYHGKSLALSPMVRGRLLQINDKEIVREEKKKTSRAKKKSRQDLNFVQSVFLIKKP
jgi:putative ABC transport system permease protein